MRFLAILLIALIGRDSHSQTRHFGHANGKAVSIVISEEQLNRTPRWSKDELEPPLSIGKALHSAKNAATKAYPELNKLGTNFRICLVEEHTSINTDHHFTDTDGRQYYRRPINFKFISERWVYWFRVSGFPVFSEGPSIGLIYDFPVAVLMDGSVIMPTEITRPLPDAEFKKQFSSDADPPITILGQ